MVKNNKGQALIESVIILPISILFFIYVVQVFIYFSMELAIDDSLEDFIFCKIQAKADCENYLSRRLEDLRVQKTAYRYRQVNNEHSIYLEATALRIFQIKKERRLNYEMIVL